MAFDDLDPIEQRIVGKPVQSMSPDELVSYIKEYVEALHGVRLVVDGIKERTVFTWLQKTYGNEDAGRIVKWVCERHKCHNEKGKVISFLAFQKERKWWIDQMYTELQLATHRARQRSMRPELATLMDSKIL